MLLSHVTIEHEFGAALHEHGLNVVSAGLRLLRPELFEKSTDIVVKPGEAGPPPSPAHVLTLYALVNDPLAFNLYPVDNAPDLPEDSFFVRADVTFSLTDSILGTVTRIGVVIEAAGTIVLDDQGAMKIRLAVRPNGREYLDMVEIRGEQPELGSTLVRGAVDAGVPLRRVYQTDDDTALGRTFRAIVNYLVDLYLREALRRSVVEFPLPPLDKVVEFGPLGYVPINRLYVRNNSLYVTMGVADGGPAAFPIGPTDPVDLRVGVSQAGIDRLLEKIVPIPIEDVSTGNDHTAFQFWTDNLEVSKLNVGLRPGDDPHMRLRVGIGGTVGMNINLNCGRFGWLHVAVPFPIDPFSGFWGGLRGAVELEPYDPQTCSGEIRATVHPAVKFFDEWCVFIVPDYRDLLRKAVQAALDKVKHDVLGSKFCHIPILGWTICGFVEVIDVAGPIIAWVLGAALDIYVGSWINMVINTLGRGIVQFIKIKPIKLLRIPQAKLRSQLGVTVQSTELLVQENGRQGELALHAWFSDLGISVPSLPAPPDLPPLPQQPDPPPSFGNTLPEFDDVAFRPAAQLSAPAWTEDMSLNFSARTTVRAR